MSVRNLFVVLIHSNNVIQNIQPPAAVVVHTILKHNYELCEKCHLYILRIKLLSLLAAKIELQRQENNQTAM